MGFEESFGSVDKKKGLSRREFLKTAGRAAITTGALAYAGTELLKERERKESIPDSSEAFEALVSGFSDLYEKVHVHEVLYVDASGKALGGPVAVERIAGKHGIVSPGKHDYNGVIYPKNIAKEWKDAQEQRLHEQFPDRQLPFRMRSTIGQVNGYISRNKSITHNEQAHARKKMTYLDVVRECADKQMPERENETLLSYMREHAFEDDPNEHLRLPKTIRTELARLLPGIAGQESNFDPNAKSVDSNTGDSIATGILQFRARTFNELMATRENPDPDISSPALQIQAAARHFTRIYLHLAGPKEKGGAGEALERIKTESFGGDDAAFERQFLVPAMVNAYNSGQGTLAKIINRYTELHERLPVRGYDVYDHMRHEAGTDREAQHFLYPDVKTYGSDSSEYTPRVYALARLLEKNHDAH